LVSPQQFEQILHVGGRLTIIAKQSLTAAALVESWEGLVNAKREPLAVVAAEKDEGIAADERRYVLSLPAAFLGDVKILIGTNAQHGDRRHRVASAAEHDGVFQSRASKLRGHERHRVDVSAECIINPHFKRPVAPCRAWAHASSLARKRGRLSTPRSALYNAVMLVAADDNGRQQPTPKISLCISSPKNLLIIILLLLIITLLTRDDAHRGDTSARRRHEAICKNVAHTSMKTFPPSTTVG